MKRKSYAWQKIAIGVTACTVASSFHVASAQLITRGSLPAEGETVGSVTDKALIQAARYYTSTTPYAILNDSVQRVCLIDLPTVASQFYMSTPHILDQPPQQLDPNQEEPPFNESCSYDYATNWIPLKWQVQTGATGGKVQLKFLSETVNKEIKVIDQTAVETAEPNQLNTFSIDHPIRELLDVEGFGVTVIGAGPAPFVDGTAVTGTRFEQGIVEYSGNPDIGVKLPLSPEAFNAQRKANFLITFESDRDADRIRDSIDPDVDGDGIENTSDNCRWYPNSDQRDANRNGIGFSCDDLEQWEMWRDRLLASDYDRDDIIFSYELKLKTDACDSDSDDDGLTDGEEKKVGLNPRLFDSDRDRLGDGLELGISNETSHVVDISRYRIFTPPGYCEDGKSTKERTLLGTDIKRFRSDLDPETKTNPRRRDTDRDGASDGREDRNLNGRRDRGERNPLKRDRKRKLKRVHKRAS